VGSRADVLDPVLLQLLLEPRGAPPVGVLPAVVGQHLLGHPVIADCSAEDLQHALGSLATVQAETHQVPGVIVHEGDDVRCLAAQPEGEDIALPKLVGRCPLKEPGPFRALPGAPLGALHQPLLPQGLPHGLRRGPQEESAAKKLGDPLHPQAGVVFLQVGDLLLDRRGYLAPSRGRRLRLQTTLTKLPIPSKPPAESLAGNPQLLADHTPGKPLLQIQLHRPYAKLIRV